MCIRDRAESDWPRVVVYYDKSNEQPAQVQMLARDRYVDVYKRQLPVRSTTLSYFFVQPFFLIASFILINSASPKFQMCIRDSSNWVPSAMLIYREGETSDTEEE